MMLQQDISYRSPLRITPLNKRRTTEVPLYQCLNRTSKRLYWHLSYYLYSLDIQTTGGLALR
jgi:hypothetical protein